MVGLDVPQPQVVVLAHGEQEVGVLGVELELVDALAVAQEVLDAVHRRRAEHADYSPGAGRGLKRKEICENMERTFAI